MARRSRPANRYRINREAVTIADSGPGPIRVAIQAVDNGPALYSARERKRVIEYAMNVAGALWIDVFLPGRFKNYAQKYLGYHSRRRAQTRGSAANIQPGDGITLYDGMPLVETGELGTRALTEATAKVIGATGKNPRIKIQFPQAHYLKAKDKAVLLRVPQHEIKAIAKKIERTIGKVIEGSTVQTSRRGRRRLTPNTEL